MSAPAAVPALEPEDEARAAIYGLTARLFYAAPDQVVLGYILNSTAFESSDTPLAQAWRALVEASRKAYPVVLENEHTELFVSTGKADITPYLTHYTMQHAMENPLVALRQQLHDWGMERRENASEPEDHISGICEIMRFAIAVQHRSEAEQKAFFDAYLYRGAIQFCDRVIASPKAAYYAMVGRFARAFFDLEHGAFAML